MKKPAFCIYAKTKTQISFAVTAKLISAFVFATEIVQSLYFLNTKFEASSHHLWLYSLVCVGPGRKPERWFSRDAAQIVLILSSLKNDCLVSDQTEVCNILNDFYMSRVVRKPAFCICENKDADQLRGKLISAFVFAT